MLHVKNLTKLLHGKKILNNISFSVNRGEIACFLGGSGTGKTTLLRAISGLDIPDAGNCMLNDKIIDSSSLKTGSTVGMVFQNYNIFEHLTVEQNITLILEKVGKLSAAEARLQAHVLLKQYGLEDKASKISANLSGGQKQRLAIARTLALKPQIICFDEPTAALDPYLKKQTIAMIQQLAADGHIVLIVTHDVSLFDRLPCTIHLLKAGNLVSTITSKEFTENPKTCDLLHNFVTGNTQGE